MSPSLGADEALHLRFAELRRLHTEDEALVGFADDRLPEAGAAFVFFAIERVEHGIVRKRLTTSPVVTVEERPDGFAFGTASGSRYELRWVSVVEGGSGHALRLCRLPFAVECEVCGRTILEGELCEDLSAAGPLVVKERPWCRVVEQVPGETVRCHACYRRDIVHPEPRPGVDVSRLLLEPGRCAICGEQTTSAWHVGIPDDRSALYATLCFACVQAHGIAAARLLVAKWLDGRRER